MFFKFIFSFESLLFLMSHFLIISLLFVFHPRYNLKSFMGVNHIICPSGRSPVCKHHVHGTLKTVSHDFKCYEPNLQMNNSKKCRNMGSMLLIIIMAMTQLYLKPLQVTTELHMELQTFNGLCTTGRNMLLCQHSGCVYWTASISEELS